LRLSLIGIIAIILVGGVNTQSAIGHQPEFEVKTVEDILDFCEFFYEEYQTLGLDTLSIQHPRFPNLRACNILYNHVAWNSEHQLRDTVLIAEIEKYLGDSDFTQERHLTEFSTFPDWVKKDAKLWVDGNSKDSTFAYGIRALIENNVISPPIIDNISNRVCNENDLCVKETDYVIYSHTSKYKNTSTEKFEIDKIDSEGILVTSKIISEEGVERSQFYLDENNKIPIDEKCCKTTKFLYKTPISIGQTIENNYRVVGTVNYDIGGLTRIGFIAQNMDQSKLLTIDKETGFLLSENFEITKIVTEWEKSSLIETNIFQDSVGIQLHDMKIPKWVKTSTMWFLDGLISESEYIQAMEYLIGKKMLIV
jgi:hypothetical protein